MKLRHGVIRFFLPLYWKFSERRKLLALQEFSQTELDSGWQSIYAIPRVKEPELKAMLFEHAREEMFHAKLFQELGTQVSGKYSEQPVITRKALLSPHPTEEEILDFLAYLHVGESEINQDFIHYAKAPIDPAIRQVFENIKKEEEGHETESVEWLDKYSRKLHKNLPWILFKHRFQHSFKLFENFMKVIGEKMMALLLSVIYFVLAPFFVSPARKRLFLPAPSQLEIFQEQMQQAQMAIKKSLEEKKR